MDSCFDGVAGTYQIIDELDLPLDCLTDEEKFICNKYLSKIIYQKAKQLIESPMCYPEFLDHMIRSSWFVQDQLDLLELAMYNPMCLETTKDFIIKNVLPKKIVYYSHLMNIEHKEFLIHVIQSCKMSKLTLMKFKEKYYLIHKDKEFDKFLKKLLRLTTNRNVLKLITNDQMKELNKMIKKWKQQLKTK